MYAAKKFSSQWNVLPTATNYQLSTTRNNNTMKDYDKKKTTAKQKARQNVKWRQNGLEKERTFRLNSLRHGEMVS